MFDQFRKLDRLISLYQENNLHQYCRTVLILICSTLFLVITYLAHGSTMVFVIISMTVGAGAVFFGIKRFINNSSEVIVVMIILVGSVSLMPIEWQPRIVSATILCSLIVGARGWHRFFRSFVTPQSVKCRQSCAEVGGSVFLLIWTLLAGIAIPEGFLVATDLTHQPGVLAKGVSFSQSLVDTPDLEFAGRSLTYSFFVEAVPRFFSQIFSISILSSGYTVTPLFCMGVFLVFTFSFFRDYQYLKTPILLLAFLPLLSNTLSERESLFNILTLSTSYSFGIVLGAACLVFLVEGKYRWLLVATMALGLVKPLFFLAVGGGTILYLVREGRLRITALVLGALSVEAVILFFLVVKGAGGGNFFFVFPQWIFVRIPSVFFGSEIFVDFKRWLTLPLPIILMTLSLYYYFKSSGTKPVIRAAAAFALAGWLGITVWTEATSLNAYAIFRGVFFAQALVLFAWLKEHPVTKGSSLFSKFSLFFFSWWFIVTIITGFDPNLIFFERSVVTKYWPVLLGAGALSGCVILILKEKSARVAINYVVGMLCLVSAAISVASLPINWGAKKDHQERFYTVRKEKLIPIEMIDASRWVAENTTPSSVLVYGKHYEGRINPQVRVALSQRQGYSGGGKYNAAIMDPKFSERTASVLFIYDRFVESSLSSRQSLDQLANGSPLKKQGGRFQDSLANERHHSKQAAVLYALSFGKEWAYFNMGQRAHSNIAMRMRSLRMQGAEESQDWLMNFVAREGIDYLFLENSDEPGEFLKKCGQQVYGNRDVKIFELRRAFKKCATS